MENPITVGDGKYTFFLDDDGLLNALRHGEPWPGFRNNNGHFCGSTLALYQDLVQERKATDTFRGLLKDFLNMPSVGTMLQQVWDDAGGVTITREEFETE